MHLPQLHEDCCPKFDPLEYERRYCYCKEICEDMMRIRRMHNRAFVRRRHMTELARPNFRVPRFQPKCLCPFRKPVEIIRAEDRKRTRTEQLSYPSAKKLLLFKKRAQRLFDEQRMGWLNRLIRKSLLSLYSRLHNAQPPKKPKPKQKWDKAEWKKHEGVIKRLAKPSKQPKPPKIDRPSKPLEEFRRLKRLSKPKEYIIDIKPGWELTPQMKSYVPTERILKMSKPKIIEDIHCREFPAPVPENALNYKATQRIKIMAEPHIRRSELKEVKEDPFAISKNALKYKASKRIEELATPKEYENVHIRANPGAVSPAALKAKATPRIIALAKPKDRG